MHIVYRRRQKRITRTPGELSKIFSYSKGVKGYGVRVTLGKTQMRRMPGWKITLEPEEEQRAEERARVKCPGQRDHPALRAGVTEEHHLHPWCPGLLCTG